MAVAQQNPADVANEFAALQFVMQQMLARLSTCTLVKVVACSNSGALSPVGTVDVQPVINQLAADGESIPHGGLFRLPYLRLQGGTDAVILDPKPGDLGLACFASRDISAAKSAAGVAQLKGTALGVNPGSLRQYDMSDGLYLGGFLNAVPTQFIRFSAEGVEVISPTAVKLKAPAITLDGAVHITGAVTADSTIVATGDVTGAGTHLHTHTHSGVVAGGANSGPPTP